MTEINEVLNTCVLSADSATDARLAPLFERFGLDANDCVGFMIEVGVDAEGRHVTRVADPEGFGISCLGWFDLPTGAT